MKRKRKNKIFPKLITYRDFLVKNKKFWFIFVFISFLYFLVICPYIMWRYEEFKVGDIPSHSIRAPFNFYVEDINRKELITLKTHYQGKKYFDWHQQIAYSIINSIEHIFELANKYNSDKKLSYSSKVAKLKKTLKDAYQIKLSDYEVKELLKKSSNQSLLTNIKNLIMNYFFYSAVVGNEHDKFIVENYMKNNQIIFINPSSKLEVGIPKNIFSLRDVLFDIKEKFDYRNSFIFSIISQLISPNLFLDKSYTDKKINEVIKSFSNKSINIAQNSIIAKSNKPVNKQIVKTLGSLKSIISEKKYSLIFFFFVLIIFNLSLMLIMLRSFIPYFELNTKNLYLATLPTLFVLLVGRIVIEISPTWGQYWILSPLSAILNFTIMGKTAALIIAINSSLFFSMLNNFSMRTFTTTLFSSIVMIIFTQKIKERKDFITAGIVSGFTYGVLILLIDYLCAPYVIKPYAIIGLLNGILSGALSLVLCPLLEHYFGITTFMRLLEITNPTYEPLMEIKRKANGTFQHSLEVAELVEYIAENLPVDVLLLRAGALYHDIGKILNPKYFTENQKKGEKNPHDTLDPFESARIIKNHVIEGIKLAKKYHLPSRVIDFIPQHHGTTLLTVFYERAKKLEKTEIVSEKEFRYPGPKPQTLEAALLHIADSVAAAIKSLDEITEESIKNLVEKIIDSRLKDGQFDESPLTFKDLSIIKNKILSYYELKLLKKRVNYDREKEKFNPSSI